MTTDNNITSGFTDDIGMMINDMSVISQTFTDITECYTSKSGHARIFAAKRFGKRYMLKCLKDDFLMTGSHSTRNLKSEYSSTIRTSATR